MTTNDMPWPDELTGKLSECKLAVYMQQQSENVGQRTHRARFLHLIHHNDRLTVVVVHHGPEINHSVLQGMLGHDESISLFVSLHYQTVMDDGVNFRNDEIMFIVQ